MELFADDNKDAVDEIINQFIEKVENELGQKDAAMTRGRLREWLDIQATLQDNQHSRGR